MNKDHLEEFVRKNRAAFDSEEPSPDLWSKIEGDLGSPASRRILPWRSYLWRAAAVVLIAGAAWTANDLTDRGDRTDPVLTAEDMMPQENPEAQELLEAEVYYASQVDSRIAEVEASLKDNPELIMELRKEFTELDSAYASLKKDLNDNMAPEQIIEAMMQNHRIKAGILAEILKQLNQEKDDNETTYDF